MEPLVSSVMVCVATRLSTVLTLVRLRTAVRSLMLCELVAMAKGFPTLFALVGLLSGMNPLMFH